MACSTADAIAGSICQCCIGASHQHQVLQSHTSRAPLQPTSYVHRYVLQVAAARLECSKPAWSCLKYDWQEGMINQQDANSEHWQCSGKQGSRGKSLYLPQLLDASAAHQQVDVLQCLEPTCMLFLERGACGCTTKWAAPACLAWLTHLCACWESSDQCVFALCCAGPIVTGRQLQTAMQDALG